MKITYAGIYNQLVPLPKHEKRFYQSILERQLRLDEPILVTPSTTGRLCITLAKQGFRVTGVDLNPEMTAIALAQKAVLPLWVQERLSFTTGDMCRVKSADPFGAILVPERGLLCLDQAHRSRAMAGFSRMLRLGGVLVFDLSLRREVPLFCYNTQFPAPWAQNHLLSINEMVDRTDNNGQLTQLLSVREQDRSGRIVQSEELQFTLHFPQEGEIARLLYRHNFRAIRLFGDFHCRRGQQGDDYEIWLANRL